jgi:hypothetical protein
LLLNTSVNLGEWLTRGTIWLALLLYVAAEIVQRVKRLQGPDAVARWLNSAGCAAFLMHVACAFDFYHHWSHAAAYAETARQTAEFVGWNSGFGLFVNYLFALVWIGEVFWLWADWDGYLLRSRWLARFVRGFFLFMILNGAFVFVRGPVRWLGLVLCVALAVSWWPRGKQVDLADPSRSA